MNEYAVRFGDDGRLVGIVTSPPPGIEGRMGVLLLNAGLIHRVGPKRLYVRLARALASLGFVVVRFDLSGVGDSDYPCGDQAHEESVRQDVRQAMALLSRERGVHEFALIGICAGAVVAFVLGCEEPRVTALGLIDPTDFGAAALAGIATAEETRAVNYFRSVSSKAFTLRGLLRFLSGRSDYELAAASLWTRLKRLSRAKKSSGSAADFVASRLRTLVDRGARLLLVYTQHGDSLDFVRLAFGHESTIPVRDDRGDRMELRVIGGADHDFTASSAQDELLATVKRWAMQLEPARTSVMAESPDVSAR